MMQPIELRGILPAVVTPFAADGRLQGAALEKLLEKLYGAGVHGVYVCGQTGEGLLQPLAQRKQAAQIAVRCAPPEKLTVIHVGAADAAGAIELARHAAHIGATAISSLPPLKGDAKAIRDYYRALAAAAELPLLLYYFPEIAPAVSEPGLIEDLLALPGVIGLKFTDYNLYRLWQLRRAGAVVFNGRDAVLAAGLLMRANGGIGSFYNLVPELFLRVFDLAAEGRFDEAYCAQNQINELIDIVLQFPLISAIKKILRWSGLDCGECHPSLPRLSTDQERELRSRLAHWSLAGHPFAGLKIE